MSAKRGTVGPRAAAGPLIASALSVGLMFGSAGTASAQTFGKNAMRTNPELASQSRLSAGRVDIVYYTPIDTLARLALPIADSCITEMAKVYQHTLAPNERVTILLYSEWEDYRQGWVFPGFMTPRSSGYTESLKGNIGVSFDADAGRLHEVVCHEVAHKYQNSIHDQSYRKHPMHDLVPKKKRYAFPPWIAEGDATYASRGISSLGEMYVRYVVNSGRVDYGLKNMLAAPRSLISYFLGSEFWRFVGNDFNSETLAELKDSERGVFTRIQMGDSLRVRFLKDQALYGDPGEALSSIYGVSIEELDSAFRLYLNLRFGRDYTRTRDAEMFADRISENPGEWYDRPYLAPPRAVSDSEKELPADSVVDLFYTAASDGYEGIFVRSLEYHPSEPPPSDPALFDACLLRQPGNCVEYGEAEPEAPPEAAEDDGALLAAGPLFQELNLTGEDRDRYRRRVTADWGARRVIRGGTEDCQTLDIRSNRIDVYQDESRRLLAYTCTDSRLQTKVVGVFDLDLDREIERYPVPGLGTIRSPTWSPDGLAIAFSGIASSGTSDLYRIDRQDGSVEKLTNDVYADGELDWSPDGGSIVFASDRGPYGAHGRGKTHANLYLLDVATREVLFLTYGDWIDRAPTWSPDGTKVLFSSDRGGAFDLYVVDRSGAGRKLTDISTGILSAQWWPDGKSIVFTAFDGGQQIYRMDAPASPEPNAPPDADLIALDDLFRGGFERVWSADWTWDEHLEHPLVQMATPARVPDRYHVTLGNIGSGFNSGFGQTGASIFFTNRDNTQLLYTSFFSGFLSGNNRTGLFDATDFENLHAEVGYLNLSKRLFWGGRCYRHSDLYADEVFQNIYGEDRIGCAYVGQYPLSTFRRIEFTAGVEWSERADFPDLLLVQFQQLRDQPNDIVFERSALLTRLGAAYVKDNSLSVGGYPVDGWRGRLDCGFDLDVSHFRADTYTCHGDVRKYFRLGPRSNWGARLFAFRSGGFTPLRFTLDWRNHMTLFPQFSLFGSTGWVANTYLAFPLIDRLHIGLPVAGIGLPRIRAALFVDMGQAWLGGQSMGPVWGDAGVRWTTQLAFIPLSLAWGKMFILNGDGLELPTRFQGTRWILTIQGTP
ncbi:MAG: hypothetical protein V3U67_10520 [Gemmatimonadota bacterium]